jgi:hypothetical protein
VAQVGCGGDLTQEALPAQGGGELWAEDLDGDLAPVFEILGEVDRSHPARAQLALEVVPVAKGGPKLRENLEGYAPVKAA